MTQPPRRQRRETAEAPCGIGALSRIPHGAGHGAADPRAWLRDHGWCECAERFQGNVETGSRSRHDGARARRANLPACPPAHGVLWYRRSRRRRLRLAAILWRRPIILHGCVAKMSSSLPARSMSTRSGRASVPAGQHVPTNDAAIEALARKRLRTIFLDSRNRRVARTFVRNLFWTISSLGHRGGTRREDACRCFGRGRTSFRSVPSVRRTSWHTPCKTPRSAEVRTAGRRYDNAPAAAGKRRRGCPQERRRQDSATARHVTRRASPRGRTMDAEVLRQEERAVADDRRVRAHRRRRLPVVGRARVRGGASWRSRVAMLTAYSMPMPIVIGSARSRGS